MSTVESSSCRAFHPIDGSDNITSLLFDLPLPTLPDGQSEEVIKKEVFFHICLDISGSMAGSGITCAKAALKRLMDHLIQVGNVDPTRIMVYPFHTGVFPRQLGKHDDEVWFKNIQAGGGTYFDPVMGEVGSKIQSQYDTIRSNNASEDVEVTVFFFTDGQGSTSKSSQQKFEDVLRKNKGLDSTVHTFGFTRGHDTKILSWMTSLGSETGCFQYIESSSEIEKSMSVTLALLGDSTMLAPRKIEIWTGPEGHSLEEAEHWKQVKLQGNRTSGQTVIYESSFTGNILKWREVLPETEESVAKGPQMGPIQEVPVRWLEKDDNECIVSINTFIQTDLLKMAETVNSITSNSGLNQEEKRSELNKMDSKTAEYSRTLGMITSTSARIKSKVPREKCMEACLATRSILNKFLGLKADAHKQGVISNSTLAEFNNLAYGQVNQSKMKAMLDERAGKNVQMLEELDEKVNKVIEAIDFDLLEQNAPENEKRELSCAFSTNTYIEALKDGDCLCMTMDVSRGPSAIADPSQLVIKSIFPTYWSSSMYTMALGHSLGTEFPENVHGGFDRNSEARIAPGLANENITGVMPLYINEEHWKVARLRIKPIMGYVVTLDAMGYAYSQLTTVPFLVLVKILNSHPMTEFHVRQTKLILDTCDAIYREAKSLRANTKKQLELWCESHTNRTADVITNNYVFLGHVISAVRAGDISKEDLAQWLPKLERCMVEEQIRRDMSWRVSSDLMSTILDWCSINYARDVEGPCRRYTDQYDDFMKKTSGSVSESVSKYYRDLYLQERKEQKGTTLEEAEDVATVKELSVNQAPIEAPTLAAPEFDVLGWELTQDSKERLDQIQNAVAPGVDKILRLLNFADAMATGVDLKQALEERLGSKAPLQLANEFFAKYSPKINLASLLQAYAHTKNADRRSVLNMMTPFEREVSTGEDRAEDEALKYVKALCEAKLTSCFSQAVSQAEERHAELKRNAAAMVFCETDDLRVAAGVLIEARFRGSTGGKLSTMCIRTRMVEPKGKIQMIIRGTHEGVQLFFDKYEADNFLHWTPCKSSIYRVFTNHHDALSYNEWCEILPDRSEYIAVRYMADSYSTELDPEELIRVQEIFSLSLSVRRAAKLSA